MHKGLDELEINEDIESKILKSEKQIKVLKFLLDNDDVLISDKVNNKINFSKLNVKVLNKDGSNYRLKLSKNYPDYKLKMMIFIYLTKNFWINIVQDFG